MVSTALEEKYEKKFNVEMRGGTRGGRDQFSWEAVKQMPYKDREMYLGVSSKIGILDKGSLFRKKDFFNYYKKLDTGDKMKEEMMNAAKEDELRMLAALGEEAPQNKYDRGKTLTASDRQDLQRKILAGYQLGEQGDAVGMGYDKLKTQIKNKPQLSKNNLHRIEGEGEDEIIVKEEAKEERKKEKKEKKRQKQIQKREQSSESREKKHKKQKKQKKQKKDKKEKKQKKQKKQKSHKQRRSYSRSSVESKGRSRSRDRRR